MRGVVVAAVGIGFSVRGYDAEPTSHGVLKPFLPITTEYVEPNSHLHTREYQERYSNRSTLMFNGIIGYPCT